MAQMTPDDINKIVWRACDTFRGTIDPAQYKDYVLVMLFLKYLTDLRNDKREEYRQKYKGDETRVERAMSRERFHIPEKADFDYLYEQRDSQRGKKSIGELIDEALATIEDANKEKLEGVFRNISFNSESNFGETKERNDRLKHLLEDFSQLDLRPSQTGNRDVIGDAYEYLIGKFAADSGKKGGEFYTPPEVSTLLARIVAPKAGDRIYDPCCGSGSLLIRAAKEIGDGNVALFGQEMNAGTWALCRMNMFLHGFDSAETERGDTIRNPKRIKDDALEKFNVVVANPPFSLDKWGAEKAEHDQWKRFDRGVPPKSRGDYAFILHMIASMAATDGRVGVVVPHGVLFRGSSEGKIRQKLIEENLLEGVVGLPANLFFGTGIPAALLFFNQVKNDDKVFFIDASRDYEEGKNQNRLRSQDIEKIVQTWKDRQNVAKYAYLASVDEIRENDFNLNIPLYVDTFEEEEEIDIEAVQQEIDGLEKELAEVRQRMAGYLKELGLTS
ncbi:type I restriction-modification system subunit M [Pseudanabaena sp. SR411]|uniref:type I restriction-modification system subunit M n=1 Tax=Pseudanabaena sp. SR411 TaxID=1980935 RepID=UPI000B991E79|nr:type I restriction-modification system subunit M [Pseudanabaena sp. SR411]OYQ62807.1 type I restriction-modification system subunit M [Pseudanabaena sp. SR411]